MRPSVDAAVRADDLLLALRPVHLNEIGRDPLPFGPRVLALLSDDHLSELCGSASAGC